MKNYIVIILALAAFNVNAQSYALGVKGGVNYSESVLLNVVSGDGVDMGDLEAQKGTALVFGVFARAGAGKWMIQPELLFSENKALVTLEDANADGMTLGDFLSINVDKVDIPVIIGYKAFNLFHLTAGPVFSYVDYQQGDPLFSISNMTLGYQAGFGFDVNKLTFDARYEGNLSKFKEYIETDNGVITVDARKNIFQFTVGYKLFN